MKSIRKTFIMLIILGICMGTVSIATAGNVSVDETTVQPTVTKPVVTTVIAEEKFRVGPTVRIRPVNDVIKSNQDGLIELYMDNPSLNDVTLSVDAHINVPSGIHVYGQGAGWAAAAGVVYGQFEIPPGSARTIYATVKAEKVGDFSVQFSGTYYPGKNKDAYQPISLTHPFKVIEASTSPGEPGTPVATGAKDTPQKPSPDISIVVAISIVAIMAYVLRRRT